MTDGTTEEAIASSNTGEGGGFEPSPVNSLGLLLMHGLCVCTAGMGKGRSVSDGGVVLRSCDRERYNDDEKS